MENLTFDYILENIERYSFVNQEMLKEGLLELKSLIGLDDVKKEVLDMLIYILVSKEDGNLDPKNTILNMLITGDPGVAKTTLSRTIGKIMAASSFLTTSKIQDKSQLKLKYINNRVQCVKKDFKDIQDIVNTLTFEEEPRKKYDQLAKYVEEHFKDIENYSGEVKFDKFIFREVSRDELVGKYQGYTASNIRKVFEEARGGVLFFDEAYSMMNSETGNDDFGQECLDMVNKLMLEMAGDVIVIFAGYEDKIRNLLFSRQKGLESRFLWHFKIQKYSVESLVKIFFYQSLKMNWKFNDVVNEQYVAKLINENKDLFESYGRDTQKLLIHTVTIYSVQKFMNRETKSMTFTGDMLLQAIEKMRKNQKKIELITYIH